MAGIARLQSAPADLEVDGIDTRRPGTDQHDVGADNRRRQVEELEAFRASISVDGDRPHGFSLGGAAPRLDQPEDGSAYLGPSSARAGTTLSPSRRVKATGSPNGMMLAVVTPSAANCAIWAMNPSGSSVGLPNAKMVGWMVA